MVRNADRTTRLSPALGHANVYLLVSASYMKEWWTLLQTEKPPKRRDRGNKGAGSVGDQRVEVVLLEPPASFEERELDHEVDADHAAAQALDEAGDRLHRPARGEHVVVDHDPRPVRDRVGRDLERVLAVLEHVARHDGLRRQLAGAARRDEPAAGLLRD